MKKKSIPLNDQSLEDIEKLNPGFTKYFYESQKRFNKISAEMNRPKRKMQLVSAWLEFIDLSKVLPGTYEIRVQESSSPTTPRAALVFKRKNV
jgi:hypothetical protein